MVEQQGARNRMERDPAPNTLMSVERAQQRLEELRQEREELWEAWARKTVSERYAHEASHDLTLIRAITLGYGYRSPERGKQLEWEVVRERRLMKLREARRIKYAEKDPVLIAARKRRTEVFRRMIECVRRGDQTAARKILIFVDGGGTTGVASGGQLLEFINMGFGQAGFTYVTVSAGTCSTAYFLAGRDNAEQGIRIYSEDMTGRRYFDPGRILRRWRQHPLSILPGPESPPHYTVVDLLHIMRVIKRGPKAWDLQKAADNPSAWYILATDADTGGLVPINAKKLLSQDLRSPQETGLPLTLQAILASIKLPMVSGIRNEPAIDGRILVDGGLRPFPFADVLKRLEQDGLPVENILVLTNDQERDMRELEQPAYERFLSRVMPYVMKISNHLRINLRELGVLETIARRTSAKKEAWSELPNKPLIAALGVGIDGSLVADVMEQDPLRIHLYQNAAAISAVEAYLDALHTHT